MTSDAASSQPGSRTAYVAVGDLQIYYAEHGAGPPLVLLHGGLATGEIMWGERPAALGQRYRVLVPDSRGHGRTDNPAGKLRYDQMADDVAGFVGALGLERPIVLGYSDGAQIAIELGLRHPDRFKALVLGGAVTGPSPQYLETLATMGFTEPGRVNFDEFERLYPEFAASIKTAHAHVYGPDYWRDFLRQISELWLGVPSYTDTQLAGIPVPSLIISGDRDALDDAVRLYRLLPHAELAVIPNADHGAGETPLFWHAVDDFLSRHA